MLTVLHTNATITIYKRSESNNASQRSHGQCQEMARKVVKKFKQSGETRHGQSLGGKQRARTTQLVTRTR